MEHPDIARAQRTGYPGEYWVGICPECGAEAEEIYVAKCGKILGCNECVTAKQPYEVL